MRVGEGVICEGERGRVGDFGGVRGAGCEGANCNLVTWRLGEVRGAGCGVRGAGCEVI